jgi:ABC-2 type transport system permease protein
MRRFLATMHKELLMLRRDRSGLLVLFVMPAILVLIMTLVQENALKTIGEGQSRILFLDNDHADISRQIETALSQANGVTLVKTLDGGTPDREAALGAVSKGAFQVCLIVPSGLTGAIRAKAQQSARQALSISAPQPDATPKAATIEVFFDPTVLGGYRSAVHNLLGRMLLGIEVQEKMAALSELLPAKVQASLKESLGAMAPPVAAIAAELKLTWDATPLLVIKEGLARQKTFARIPNAVQQNVPAWSLFGVFFIVLPMAGSFIKERLSGVQQRMLAMPVSYLTLVAGKVCTYLLVALVQFSLIVGIGKWVLPLLGSPAFDMGSAPVAVVVVALSAALAATGYGVLLGTVINSYEQAAMFGPISIVLAAAIGGIMVPVYAMPAFMQRISTLSPLAWGQNAFQALFVRGGQLAAVGPEIAYLLGFALVCVGISWGWFVNRRHHGA